MQKIIYYLTIIYNIAFLIGCQKDELQQAEDVAVRFMQSLYQDPSKTKDFIYLGELSNEKQTELDNKLPMIISELSQAMILNSAAEGGFKEIKVISSKFTNDEQTRATVLIQVIYQNNSEDTNDTIQLQKVLNGKWKVVLD